MLDKLIGVARSQFLKRAEKTIQKAHKEGRLVFREDGNVEYASKGGVHSITSLDNTAQRLLDIMASYLTGKAGAMADPAMIGVTVEDIKGILEDIKGASKRRRQ